MGHQDHQIRNCAALEGIVIANGELFEFPGIAKCAEPNHPAINMQSTIELIHPSYTSLKYTYSSKYSIASCCNTDKAKGVLGMSITSRSESWFDGAADVRGEKNE